MGLHNEQVSNHNAVHGTESLTLRDFHEGDIVYCHFPSKSLIAELVLQSKKIKMDYVGPLYVYSKFDKFQFALSTIDGEVIEQLFHVARLKKGLLRLPNGKTDSNIKDYLKLKSDMQNELHKTATTNSGRSTADKVEPRPSTTSMIHIEDAIGDWFGTKGLRLFTCLIWKLMLGHLNNVILAPLPASRSDPTLNQYYYMKIK